MPSPALDELLARERRVRRLFARAEATTTRALSISQQLAATKLQARHQALAATARFGGTTGLEAATREIRDHNARKRAGL